jgi:hypothetical protein
VTVIPVVAGGTLPMVVVTGLARQCAVAAMYR